MDVTALQQTITTLQGQEATEQAALDATQQQLAVAQQQLADANVINYLEGLDALGVEALIATLAGDPQNTSGITVSLPASVPPSTGAQA